MKCKNCGAPLTITQRFCPNCGSPNEQSSQHISDMNKYDKEFKKTRTEVVSNSKWFIKYVTPITVLAISIIAAAIIWAGSEGLWGYDLADKHMENYNRSHSQEISNRLNSLLDQKQYYALYAIHSEMQQSLDMEDASKTWGNFYDLSSNYSEIRSNIMMFFDSTFKDSYSRDSALSQTAGEICSIEKVIKGGYTYRKDAEETKIPMDNIIKDYRTFLKVYCNFTDKDIESLGTKEQTEVLSLLTRRMFDDEK